jgi:hypothetical protein
VRGGVEGLRDFVTDGKGEASTPWGETIEVSEVGTGFAVLATAPLEGGGVLVVVARTATLDVEIVLADGADVSAAVQPMLSVVSLWRPRPDLPADDRLASPDWARQRARRSLEKELRLSGPRTTMTMPVVGRLCVAGCALGYRPESKILPTSVGSTPLKVRLELQRAEVVRVKVVGPDGSPVEDSVIQLITHREVPIGDYDEQREDQLCFVTGRGFGAKWGRDSEFVSLERRVEVRGTPTTIAMPFLGDHRVLIVHAPGFCSGIERLPDGPVTAEIGLQLVRRPPGSPEAYRLTRNGTPMEAGTLFVCEEVDGWTPALPPIRCERGLFAAESIDPRKTYTVLLETPTPPRVLLGRMAFGMEREVDISALSEQ